MPSLVEIDRTLPNGFHDSEVRAYKLDFVKRTAMFEIDVWVGDLDAATPDGRELYRAGLLVVSGLAFCKVDAPYDRAGGVRGHLARLGEGLVGTEQHGLLRVVATRDDLEEQIETVDEGREAAWAARYALVWTPGNAGK